MLYKGVADKGAEGSPHYIPGSAGVLVEPFNQQKLDSYWLTFYQSHVATCHM
jgi:hypothetical protein